MSVTIFEFAKSFVKERLSASTFADAYIELWKIERDKKILEKDDPVLAECLSSIFLAADMYNPSEEREEYEFDAERLVAEILKILNEHGLS